MKLTGTVNGRTAAYAAEELTRLWGAVNGPDYNFEFVTDPTLAPYTFGYEGCADCGTVRIIGRDEAALVPAVYHALTAAGFYFDTETHPPRGGKFRPEALFGRDLLTPFVGLRGIRQHINFPMDISSYTLADAKEYIRMLARLGMNAITFHSYDGFWHRNPGGFFYDKPHFVDTHPVLTKSINNEKYYISPDCEKDFDDRAARGRFAIDFLRGLMDTAKTCGMHVTLSMEPAEDAAVTLEALSFYPDTDMLELITPEGGGTAPENILDEAGLTAKARELFGEAALLDGKLTGFYEKDEHSPRLYPSMLSLRRAMNQLPQITGVPVRVGLYITDPETLCVIKGIMDRVLPKDMIFTYLAAHGTDAVIANLSQKNMLTGEDFSRTVIHAWSEFDGNMYILQNAANAEARLLAYAKESAVAEQIHAMYFNHWRTAENNFAIAAAGAFTKKPADVRDFYKRYAEAFDLCPDTFAELMYRLGELDVYCRDKLFNIGFCYRGCWVSAGLNWMKYKTCDRIETAIAEFNGIREALLPLVDAARKAGSGALPLLSLLENRIRVSIAHLHMTHAIREIEEEMPPEQIKECLDRSRRYAEEYLLLHAECMPERASEGTMASYFNCMFGYLDALRDKYLANLTVDADHDKSVIDAPAVVDAPAQA